jgi:hypothetical protein
MEANFEGMLKLPTQEAEEPLILSMATAKVLPQAL